RGARLRPRAAARAAARDARGDKKVPGRVIGVDLPPGPRMPSLMQAAFVTASPYGWMVKRWRRYGDVFSSRFPIFGRVVYVAARAFVREVFTADATTFHAGEANTLALGDAFGEHSLLTPDEGRQM